MAAPLIDDAIAGRLLDIYDAATPLLTIGADEPREQQQRKGASMSSYNAGPIRHAAAAKVCTLAGLNQAYKGLVTLRQLDRGMEIALQEVEAAQTKAELIDTALVVARFTKATCDAFISLAAALSLNEKAEQLGRAYGVLSIAAGVVGDLTAGARVDTLKLTTDALKAGAEYMRPNAGYLTKSVAVKGELVHSAMNAKQKDVLKSAVEYSADLATYTLDHLKEIEKGTKTGGGAGLTSKFIKISKEVFLYNDKLREAFDAYLEDKEATHTSFRTQKQTIKATAENIRRRARELEGFIESCEAHLKQHDSGNRPAANSRLT